MYNNSPMLDKSQQNKQIEDALLSVRTPSEVLTTLTQKEYVQYRKNKDSVMKR